MAEINNDEKRITVSGEQIEEAVGKVPTIEADVKANKQSISALQDDVSKHTADIAKNTADIEKKANAEEVYSREETDNAITAKVAEIVAGSPEEFDTLKEMSDWLTEHSDSAATMNSAIQANTKAIADNVTAIEENTADIEQNKTDVLSAENDIAVNRTTLGTQCKNLLNHTAKTETVNGVNITVNTDGSITFAGTFNGTSAYYHQIYKNADGSNKTIGKGKYIVSGGAEEFGFFVKHGTNFSGNNGTQFNVKTSDVPITIEYETERIEFFVSLSPAREYNATIYPMLRSADITDNTYEPYKPSLQEQINNSYTSLSEQIEKHYGLGTIIPSGADLNDSAYFKPGVYRAPSNSVAESLLNCPIKRGFRMEVKTTIYDGMAVRFIYPNAHSALFGTYYMQNIISDGVSNWYKFSGEEIIPTSTTTE